MVESKAECVFYIVKTHHLGRTQADDTARIWEEPSWMLSLKYSKSAPWGGIPQLFSVSARCYNPAGPLSRSLIQSDKWKHQILQVHSAKLTHTYYKIKFLNVYSK